MTTIQVPQQTSPAAAPDSAATRHLCVAAYIDEDFQQESLRQAYFQSARVVAPSYGFRLVPVLWHCLRARRAAIIRDSILVGLLVFTLCGSGLTWLVVAGNLLLMHIAVSLARLVRDTVTGLRDGVQVNLGAVFVRGLKLLFQLLALIVLWVFTFFIAAAAAAAAAINSFGTGGSAVDVVIGTMMLGVLVTLLVIAVPAITNLWRQHQIEQFVPGRHVGNGPPSARFAEIDQQQRGNTVVYSGYHPFVGSGDVIESEGFAQRLIRPTNGAGAFVGGTALEADREFEVPPFAAQELIEYVGNQLQVLVAEPRYGGDPNPEDHVPGLTVTDCVALAGTEVSYLSTFTDPVAMARLIRHPTTPARHYLACQVISWDGELVTTVYIHFAMEGKTLYIELTTTALTPCDERYRMVDHLGGTGPMAYLRALGRGVADSPRTVAHAPLNLIRTIVESAANRFSPYRASPSANTAMTVTRGYDYGAQVGVRELGASAMTHNRVQAQDVFKYKRIIERRVLASVLDFLESRGVDTSEYRERALNILNAGAVNMGSGSMNVQNPIGQQVNSPAPQRTPR